MRQYHHKSQITNHKSQRGQTLIETLAAVFILVMGVSAAVGLAVYALNSSGGIVKQIVATGLAREGLEAVRNMRDTNWLKDTLSVNDCWDFVTGQADKANCYPYWIGKNNSSYFFCINPSPGNSCNGNNDTNPYYLGFDYDPGNKPNFWYLEPDNSKYGLNFDSTNFADNGFYSPGTSGVTCSNMPGRSDYCRKIILTNSNSAPPYDKDIGPMLFVQSRVWWVDKKCPRMNDWDETAVPPKIPPAACRVEMDTYLTNWKNY